MIWMCYLVIGLAWITGLFRYDLTMLAVVMCVFVSVALRFIPPSFPTRKHTRLQALVLVPLFVLVLAAKHISVDPAWQQIAFDGFFVMVAVSLIFQAYEDARVWRSNDGDMV